MPEESPESMPAWAVRLETKVDLVLQTHGSQLADHEARIRGIEKYLWIWIGAAGAIGAGASQLISKLIGG